MYRRKIVLGIVLIGLVIGGFLSYKVYTLVLAPNTAFQNEEAFLYIPTGADIQEVRNQLDPLLKDPESFQMVADKKKYTHNIRPGKYRISKGMNNNDIINTLRVGNLPVKLSFNNQERLQDLAGRVAAQIEADSTSLYEAFADGSFLNANGFTPDDALSMYLPNSYEFFWNTSAQEFRDRMLKEYQRFWTSERKELAKKQGLSPQQVSALAAIVHKETAKAEERPRVAGLYLNRIHSNMALQADPTVIYAIKKTSGNFDTVIKRVLYKDLELDSPYNTYKYRGVPPGPITMPDLSAIKAVLNPEKHNYLYMVADVENFGYHMFAETIQQHNRNKEQYIRWINDQKIMR